VNPQFKFWNSAVRIMNFDLLYHGLRIVKVLSPVLVAQVSDTGDSVAVDLRVKVSIVSRSLLYLFHNADIMSPNNNSQI
jgi:hypothetical protein